MLFDAWLQRCLSEYLYYLKKKGTPGNRAIPFPSGISIVKLLQMGCQDKEMLFDSSDFFSIFGNGAGAR